MRMISGPQGPRVVLDGRPVLLLSSPSALGLADHPRLREAAADAAMRWGAGAGGSREAAGTMAVHRQLEERLAEFHGTEVARLVDRAPVPLVPGAVVFADALSASAPCVPDAVHYVHGDAEHLELCLRRRPDRPAEVLTDAISADGDLVPLEELAGVARRHGARLVVDESLSVGTLGPDGRGALAQAGVDDAVVVGSLAHALGTHGRYVAGDADLVAAMAPTDDVAPAPPVVAAALAALDLLIEQPRRVDRLAANADVLRDGLAREGFDVTGSVTHLVALVIGHAADAQAMAAAALGQGVHVQAVAPADGPARLRLCVMASHTRQELAEAARVLGRAALKCGLRPGTMVSVAEAQAGAEVVPLIPRAA